jgi:hypothetical protein
MVGILVHGSLSVFFVTEILRLTLFLGARLTIRFVLAKKFPQSAAA